VSLETDSTAAPPDDEIMVDEAPYIDELPPPSAEMHSQPDCMTAPPTVIIINKGVASLGQTTNEEIIVEFFAPSTSIPPH